MERLHKALEDAGERLFVGGVVGGVIVLGRAMLDALVAGECDATVPAGLAKGRTAWGRTTR